MKHLLIFTVFLLAHFCAQSQDVIVTNEGDTIDCKITRISNEFVHFSVFDENGFLLLRSRLPLSQIQSYEQNEESEQDSQPADTPEIKEEDRIIIDEFDPATFRLAVNTGYTHQFSGYELWPASYRKQLQSLWNLGGELDYFFSEVFGVGAKFNHAFTQANQDFDPSRYAISSIRDERIRFSYAALALIYRNFLYDDQVVQYFVSGGFIRYRTDGLVDGNTYYEEGDTFGLAVGVTYDFLLLENFGVGAGLEINFARLTELDVSGAIVNTDFPINRIDLTLGFRLFR